MSASASTQLLTFYNVHIVFIIIFGGLSCYLPIFMGISSNLEDTALAVSIQSISFRESSMAILAINACFAYTNLLERLGDIFSSSYMFATQSKYQKKMKIIADVETLLFLAGTIAVPVVALLGIPPVKTIQPALIYVCASQVNRSLLVTHLSVRVLLLFSTAGPYKFHRRVYLCYV